MRVWKDGKASDLFCGEHSDSPEAGCVCEIPQCQCSHGHNDNDVQARNCTI